ncbi:DNA (cytosine-5-)-methyltransferase [Rhodococcus sp. 15-649-2-2]|nr:DNA (cytosine-5-)-methyltransferase [Rhodococcus sp. 15-649-2-2]
MAEVGHGGSTDVELPKVVSLFSGAGGLDHGYHSVGFPLVLAVDSSRFAIKTHKRNFPSTTSVADDLISMQPEGVLKCLANRLSQGDSIGIIGGPPCQGFSRANTGSKPDDPRNKLPTLYLEIIEALQTKYDVRFVIFENVQGIRDAKHSQVFNAILDKFASLGLSAKVEEHSALDYGVAQTRNRVIISAFASAEESDAFRPAKIRSDRLTVRDRIAGLPEPVYFSRAIDPADIPFHPNHWTMKPVSKRFRDPDGAGSSGRSFRRLDWDKPSPTVAYGHREIHVHPSGTRRLSIYEAMLLQGFPHDFVLEGTLSAQVEQISNAVPPPVALALAEATAAALNYSTAQSMPRQLQG